MGPDIIVVARYIVLWSILLHWLHTGNMHVSVGMMKLIKIRVIFYGYSENSTKIKMTI
jgi:hypothetical protein